MVLAVISFFGVIALKCAKLGAIPRLVFPFIAVVAGVIALVAVILYAPKSADFFPPDYTYKDFILVYMSQSTVTVEVTHYLGEGFVFAILGLVLAIGGGIFTFVTNCFCDVSSNDNH